jgi:hypothetical protein
MNRVNVRNDARKKKVVGTIGRSEKCATEFGVVDVKKEGRVKAGTLMGRED